MMKSLFKSHLTFLALTCSIFACKQQPEAIRIGSPDGSIQIVLENMEGALSLEAPVDALAYSVLAHGDTVVRSSRLGLVARNPEYNFDHQVLLSGVAVSENSESYSMISGKAAMLSADYKQLEVRLTNAARKEMSIFLRVFNDGFGFRYEIRGPARDSVIVERELTTFTFNAGKKWILPYDEVTSWSPAYEAYFENGIPIGSPAPGPEGWSFPVLLETGDHWMLLSESGLDASYCGTHLESVPGTLSYGIRFPEEGEHYGEGWQQPRSSLPWTQPWRFIAIGRDLHTIVENNLVYHLAYPNKIKDVSWIKPGIASWDWWSSRGGRELGRMKAFVDLADDFGWKYSLVDAGWERMQGGSLEDLVVYAKAKDVDLLLWYNSGGRRREENMSEVFLMEDRARRRFEFERIHRMGIKGVKIDFFNSDKQNIIQQYIDILEDAADFELLVNFHGCTLPRGWTRTYPHLLTMEAVRGAESYRYDAEYPEKTVWLNTILPFTRNVVGPMDYTPVVLSDNRYPHLTTAAHELATAVVFESGITHMADRDSSYLHLPEQIQQLLSVLPASWDETRLMEGYPGKYCVIARRNGNDWWVAGINGPSGRTINPDVSFLGEISQQGLLIGDGEARDDLRIDFLNPDRLGALQLSLKPGGGFIIYFGR